MTILLFLFLLSDRISESAEFFAECEILAVGKCGKGGTVKAELTVFVEQFFVNVNGDDLRNKHIVASERHDLFDTALDRER